MYIGHECREKSHKANVYLTFGTSLLRWRSALSQPKTVLLRWTSQSRPCVARLRTTLRYRACAFVRESPFPGHHGRCALSCKALFQAIERHDADRVERASLRIQIVIHDDDRGLMPADLESGDPPFSEDDNEQGFRGLPQILLSQSAAGRYKSPSKSVIKFRQFCFLTNHPFGQPILVPAFSPRSTPRKFEPDFARITVFEKQAQR